MNLKEEILNYIPNPREIELPNYIERTITEEINLSGLSSVDIETGKEKLSGFYSSLKKGLPLAPSYSELEVYIAYIDTYLRMYYPRMAFTVNNLLKYTNFYELLNDWSEKPIKILDIGAGPGTMFIAFIEYLENINQENIFDFQYEISVFEEEENFIHFLERLKDNIEIMDSSKSERISFSSILEPNSIDFDDLESNIGSLLENKKYNVIILSFIINENDPNHEKIRNLFTILSNYLKQSGIIIFIGAASDYIYEYFEIDFKEETNLNRIAPCLNGNKIYDPNGRINFPFFRPCGDLCTFQITPMERHRFCYLVLSKTDLVLKKYNDHIQNSIGFYSKYKHLVPMFRSKRDKEMEKINEFIDVLGIFSDRSDSNYYICNGACKFKVIDETGSIDINEGDVVLLKNVKFDGNYQKINKFKGNYIRKPYAEIGVKFQAHSSFEIIPYF